MRAEPRHSLTNESGACMCVENVEMVFTLCFRLQINDNQSPAWQLVASYQGKQTRRSLVFSSLDRQRIIRHYQANNDNDDNNDIITIIISYIIAMGKRAPQSF